jgi:transcriptional regulator of acetoin/glycerol metabolism
MEASEFRRLQTLGGREPSGTLPDLVAASWKRCLDDYHLLPDVHRHADILSSSELRDATERLETLVRSAGPEVDKLFQQLRGGDYLVTLASADGVMLTFRCDPYWLDQMRQSGVAPGSVWSEELQGTNGVGTCIKAGHALTIMGDQHFNVAVKHLTCTVAPLLGAGGQVAGVLNVTSMTPENVRTARLLRSVVERSARRIEIGYFKARNSNLRLIDLSRDGDFSDTSSLAVIAVDDLGKVVDASPSAASMLGRAAQEFINARLADIMDPSTGISARPAHPEVNHFPGHRLFDRRPKSELVSQRQARTPAHRGFADARFGERLIQAARLFRGHLPIVVSGEPGCGKSVFARTLAEREAGTAVPVVVFNCATPALDLERSLCTLPRDRSMTVILDQADDMPSRVQRRLLSLLEDEMLSHIRLITIITESLYRLVARNRIRGDLAARLRGANIALPPLRTSPDLESVVHRVFASEAELVGRTPVPISPEAMAILKNHLWPGNLREMTRAVRHAGLMTDVLVRPIDLPEYLFDQMAHRDVTARSESEALRIEAALRFNGWNVAKTAKYLGISRATLYRKIEVNALKAKRSAG